MTNLEIKVLKKISPYKIKLSRDVLKYKNRKDIKITDIESYLLYEENPDLYYIDLKEFYNSEFALSKTESRDVRRLGTNLIAGVSGFPIVLNKLGLKLVSSYKAVYWLLHEIGHLELGTYSEQFAHNFALKRFQKTYIEFHNELQRTTRRLQERTKSVL